MVMVSDGECLEKKSKLLTREVEWNHISFLQDELLLEILCRLPCSKSAVQCKSVCKRWAAVISSPFFISRLIADKKRKHLETFCTLLLSNHDTWSGMTMYLRNPHFNYNKLSFSSLPSSKCRNPPAFTVYALCNDLLLYCELFYCELDELEKQVFYICNIQTEEWLPLPMPSSYEKGFAVGFTCDPHYYYYDHEQTDDDINSNKIILNPAYRYSIVLLSSRESRDRSTMMTGHLFSNTATTSEWREIVVSVPKPWVLVYFTPSFVFDGKLYFLCDSGVIGFDPYDEDGNNSGVFKGHSIDWPPGIWPYSLRFNEYQGRLHLYVNLAGRLQMWCLKDYKMGEWSLQHNIIMEDCVIRDERLSSTYVIEYMSLELLVGVHPTHPDVVYICFPDWIALCNLSTRTLEIASPIDARAAKLFPTCVSSQSMLPIWPTPLPALRP